MGVSQAAPPCKQRVAIRREGETGKPIVQEGREGKRLRLIRPTLVDVSGALKLVKTPYPHMAPEQFSLKKAIRTVPHGFD